MNFVECEHQKILNNKRGRYVINSHSILKYELNFDLTTPLQFLFWDNEEVFVVDYIILGADTGQTTLDVLVIYSNGVYIRQFMNIYTGRMEFRSNVELDLINGKLVMTDNSKVSK